MNSLPGGQTETGQILWRKKSAGQRGAKYRSKDEIRGDEGVVSSG
jgi:hypothetical protein